MEGIAAFSVMSTFASWARAGRVVAEHRAARSILFMVLPLVVDIIFEG
jgi:hypothetical protein